MKPSPLRDQAVAVAQQVSCLSGFIRFVYFGLCGSPTLICFAIESQKVPISSF
jgi:hypothetical protein